MAFEEIQCIWIKAFRLELPFREWAGRRWCRQCELRSADLKYTQYIREN